MKELPTVFAALDMDEMRGQIVMAIRIVACVFGAALGWFLASPIFRTLYRMFSPRKGIPGGMLFVCRLGSAGAVAAIVFVLSAHFGLGGLGFGNGPGNGPGAGPGKGPGTGLVDKGNSTDSAKGNTPDAGKVRQTIEIEMMPDLKEDKNFYLVKLKDTRSQPTTLEDVKKLVEKNKAEWSVRITFNSDGDTPSADAAAVKDLEKFLDEKKVPHSKAEEKK